jgi:quercetin dioxygenase-like cupin family protein
MTKNRPVVKRWSWEKTLSEPAIAKTLSGKGYRTVRWTNEAGYAYPIHTHDFDKVILVLRGSITFRIPRVGEEFVLHVGDRMDIPAGYAHSAEVGPQGVTCIEGQDFREEDHQDP